MFILVLLAFFFADINALKYDVSCANDGVYLRWPVITDADMNEMPHVFAMTKDKLCNANKIDELVRVKNCGSMKPIRLYVANGTNAYDVLDVTCTDLYDVSVPGRVRRLVIGDTDNGTRMATTSVLMESKLVFSDLAEIQPVQCSPENSGILYIGNPDPFRFRSCLAYDSVSNAMCKTKMIDGYQIVAIYDCSLAQTVIISFSTANVHNGIIGGSPGTFRTYKISCYDDTAIKEPTDFTLIIKSHGDKLHHSILFGLLLPFVTLLIN
ncbi:hypothetical protein DPMN_116118 [Dreissena polymorpha]|uniref:Uncharacterized protein n=2 Tax=Dreissena polymorpha TaxID=45954 RepID=A0A9D4KN96_DREPO|nr:hypothetical protein DPMN_116118 [Dreissena polymorpha]